MRNMLVVLLTYSARGCFLTWNVMSLTTCFLWCHQFVCWMFFPVDKEEWQSVVSSPECSFLWLVTKCNNCVTLMLKDSVEYAFKHNSNFFTTLFFFVFFIILVSPLYVQLKFKKPNLVLNLQFFSIVWFTIKIFYCVQLLQSTSLFYEYKSLVKIETVKLTRLVKIKTAISVKLSSCV